MPDEQIQGPGVVAFPESVTTSEGRPLTFTFETQNEVDKGKLRRISKK